MERFFKFLAGLASYTFAIIFNALVLKVLWGWFMVPLGLFHLSLTQAIGLDVVVGFFLSYIMLSVMKDSDDSWSEQMVGLAGMSLVMGAYYLGLGFIIHLFM